MRLGKWAVLLGLTALCTVGSAAPVDLNTLTLNGDAAMVGPVLRVVPAVTGQAGSAFTSSPVSLSGNTVISTSFELYIHGGSSADGMTFVIQNSPAADTARGPGGGKLGYDGITNSIAVEFDTYQNSSYSDPNNNHVGIDQNGSLTSLATYTPAWDMEDDVNHIFGWLDYDTSSQILKVYVNNSAAKPASPQLTQSIDLLTELGGNQAYFGFTASTGAWNNNHDVLSWDLNVTHAESVPLGDSGKLALALLMAVGVFAFMRRRKYSPAV